MSVANALYLIRHLLYCAYFHIFSLNFVRRIRQQVLVNETITYCPYSPSSLFSLDIFYQFSHPAVIFTSIVIANNTSKTKV